MGAKFGLSATSYPKDQDSRYSFVGKTPAPVSVAACHYFQGAQGRMFWSRLRESGLLKPTTRFEDDSLLDHGFGMTDIVKVPRSYENEPSAAEYIDGLDRVLGLICIHSPAVVVFVYKRVLDQILAHYFGIRDKSDYGFNPGVDRLFGARVFVFPLPGTPCTKARAEAAMRELVEVLGSQ